MSRPVKYNPVMRYSIVELYGEGLSYSTIAEHLGVSLRTICYWIKKYDLKEIMDNKRSDTARDSIEQGLRKLAKGASDETVTDKYVTTRKHKTIIIDDFGDEVEEIIDIPVERTITKKIKAPDSKAIEILARKYYKDFDSKAEEREINTKILEGFTMRELQEARKNSPIDKGQYVEAEFRELSTENKESQDS